MQKVARWCIKHRLAVVLIWISLLVGAVSLSSVIGSNYENDFSLPNTDSQRANDLLQREFPEQAGDTDQIVFSAKSGRITDKGIQAAIDPMLARVAKLPHVSTVTTPFGPTGNGAISRDGKIAFSTVIFDRNANLLSLKEIQKVVDVAQSAASSKLQVELGGMAIERTQIQPIGGLTMIGIGAAMVVLLVAFGSFLAMGMPIVTALFGLGTGFGLIILGSHLLEMADFSEQLALMIGLGVGVDYALFIVTRYRDAYRDNGGDVRRAVELAMNTSGRAILFAGGTVIIALMGLFTLGLSFLYGVALASSLAVLFVMLASLTLLPAFLSFGGHRLGKSGFRGGRRKGRGTSPASNHKRNDDFTPAIDSLSKTTSIKDKSAVLNVGSSSEISNSKSVVTLSTLTDTETAQRSKLWLSWIGLIQRWPWVAAIGATVLMLVLMAPAFSMRLGLSDAGNDRPQTTTRKAYDLLASGFGPGFNGPLIVVAQLAKANDQKTLKELDRAISVKANVGLVTPPRLNKAGDVATMSVFPRSSPQTVQTTKLVKQLRSSVIPPVEKKTGSKVYLGGATAVGVDFSQAISEKLALFIGIVILLSALLLMAVFRSLVIPIQAAIMNMLSIGASMGIVVALFQFGWFSEITGLQSGPIEAWLPVLVFAIVFGLSMDYEVFLVSRIHEEWVRRRDNNAAVREGLLHTGLVISAAAIVMVVVFASFVSGGVRVIELFGIALATAVFLDAIVVRTILLPAVLEIIGERTWYLPRWLDRRLPQVTIEPEDTVISPQVTGLETVGSQKKS